MLKIKVSKEIRFVNIGEDPPNPTPDWNGKRQWNACVEYGFISSGQGTKYNKPLTNLKIDDIVAAYKTGSGYVGIGIVTEKWVPIKDFEFQGMKMDQLEIEPEYISGMRADSATVKNLPLLRKNLFRNADNQNTEYVVRVEWLKAVSGNNAFWCPNSGLFASPIIQGSLRNQPSTKQFLEASFQVLFL